MSDITIRNSRPTDAAAIRRLAALDSRPVPTGDALVAEVGGEIVAVRSATGAVADPFRPTADVVELLDVRMRSAASAATRWTPERRTRRLTRAGLRLA
jgi:hypothetical protein